MSSIGVKNDMILHIQFIYQNIKEMMMPNRKAKERKQERKRKHEEIKRWKRQQKLNKKGNK